MKQIGMPKPPPDLLPAALNTWRKWDCDPSVGPGLIKKISAGLTNQHYLLQCGEHLLVLRLHNPNSFALGINRSNELIILNTLAPAGLVPRLRYWSPDNRFSVSDYVDGRMWTERDLLSPPQKIKLQKTIQRYQEFQPAIASFDYHRHLSAYWRQLSPHKKSRLIKQLGCWQVFSKRLLCYQAQHWPRVLVHHDLNPCNIIESDGKIFILDWEYAGLGCSALDYASVNLNLNKMVPAKTDFIHEIRLWLEQLWWAVR